MSTHVPLPALGESVTEGTISRWLKQVGDRVEVDEALVEVSTDKVDTEIPSPAAGIVLEIRYAEDDVVPVGDVLAVIGDESEAPGGNAPAGEPTTDESVAPAPAAAPGDAASEPPSLSEEVPSTDAPAAQPAEDQAAGEHDASGAAAGAGSASASASGTDVTLPALGESVTEGTISRWLKRVGDSVEVDEAIVEVSTDKVDTEVPSPVAGTVLELRFSEDDVVPVGAVLAVVGDAAAAPAGGVESPSQPTDQQPADQQPVGQPEAAKPASMSVETLEDQVAAGDEGGQKPIPAPTSSDDEAGTATKVAPMDDQAATSSTRETSAAEQTPQPVAARRAVDGGDAEGIYVTPLVRKLAAEHGVDLASLTGTGVGGRIRKQDVIAAAEAQKRAAEEAAAKAKAEADAAARAQAEAEAAAKAQAEAQAAARAQPAEQPAASVPASAVAAAPAPTAGDQSRRGTTEKMTRLRSTIARRMVESLQISAQLTATVEVDLTAIARLRARVKDDFKKREGASLSYLPFIAKVAVETLKQLPVVNATIDTDAGTITYADAEHLGIAVDTDKGLLVPVIKNAGDLNIAGLAKKIADLAARTRANKVTPDELTGGTFTITNYGSAGTLMDTPIINQPQVAILGTGALVKRPMVVSDPALGEVIAVRDMMYLSMTYDHRLVDGAVAARFLSAMKARLEAGDFGAEFGV